jgi:hypothetical protein
VKESQQALPIQPPQIKREVLKPPPTEEIPNPNFLFSDEEFNPHKMKKEV